MPSKIIFSTVSSVHDMRPQRTVERWESFVKRLSQVRARGKYKLEQYLALSRPEKRRAKNGPGWVPGSFIKKGKREDADLKKLFLFVGDCDNNTSGVPVTIDSLQEALNGYEYAIHTTFSHSREKAKFRFVLPLASPVKAAEYVRLFDHFNAKLNGALDPKGKTPSQLFFWPSCPPDALKLFRFIRGRGKWLDPHTVKPVRRLNESTVSGDKLEVVLPQQLPKVNLDDLKISRRIRKLIEEGDDGTNRYASRSETIWAAAIALASIGASNEQIAGVLIDEANAVSEKVREQKNPRKYLIRTLKKIRALKFVGDPETIDAAIAELNEHHAVVGVGGRTLILNEAEDPVLKRRDITFSTETDLRLLYANKKLVVNEKPTNVADLWINHEARRQYSRVIFSPERDVPGCYNLWRGYAIEPSSSGKCDLYLRHIRDNIADGDEAVYRHIIGFMADAVQNPGTLPGVALVMRGDEGVGKGIFATEFGRLFGQHFIQVSHARHLVGNFNAHLKDVLVVFADEAFWAGDKSSQGALNAVITERLRMLEHKGKDAMTVANMCRVIIASNHDWVVPAGPMARRFFMIDVSSKHRQDVAYFKAINKQMTRGGREALLHYLLNYDLTGFEMRDFPRTAALLDQQIRSMSPDEKFWFGRLRIGELVDYSGKWGDHGRVKCRVLHDQYIRSLQKDGYTRRSSESEFGIFLTKMCPDVIRVRRRMSDDGERQYVYEFPSLERCRELYAARMNTTIDWKKP